MDFLSLCPIQKLQRENPDTPTETLCLVCGLGCTLPPVKISQWYEYESRTIKGFKVEGIIRRTNKEILAVIAEHLKTQRPEGEPT